MNGKVYDSGSELQNIDVLRCRAFPVPRIVQDKTLGGSWFVQTIGTAAVKAAVDLKVEGITARDAILSAWCEGANITVDFDGYRRTGFILDEPKEDMVKRSEDPEKRLYSMSFGLAVQIEEAIT